MNNVNIRLLIDMTLDFKARSEECPCLDRIWRYIMYSFNYVPHTIVIGQTPYPEYLIPELGSAFSQVSKSTDTPTARIFSLHFDNPVAAASMMRNNWALLPRGYVFLNADYLPSSLGGGDAGIECVRRISRTIELLFLLVITRVQAKHKVTLLSVGSLAGYCGSSLSRRLRSVGVSIEHLGCRQPVMLARLQYNTHLIGKDPRYMFAKPRVLTCFNEMINAYSSSGVAKVSEIITLHKSIMSSDKHNAMTYTAINDLLSKSRDIENTLSQAMAAPHSIQDCKAQLEDVREVMKEVNTSVQGLLNLLLADAYTYRAVVDSESKQVPVASREQHMQGSVDFGSEVQSIDASSISKMSSITQASAPPSDNKKVKDLFTTVQKTSGRKTTTTLRTPVKPTKPSQPSSSSSGTTRYKTPSSSSSSKPKRSVKNNTPDSMFIKRVPSRQKDKVSRVSRAPPQSTPMSTSSKQSDAKTPVPPVQPRKTASEFTGSNAASDTEVTTNSNMLELLNNYENNN